MKKELNLIRKTFEGFTLIELILYMAIVSVVTTSLISFGWNIINNGIKSTVDEEVYSNGRYIAEKIKYEIRNASGINTVNTTSISLSESNPADNPTVINLSSSRVTIKKGAAAAVSLNSNDTAISNLVFTNYSSLDNKTKNIQFSFTIFYKANSVRGDYQSSANFEGDGEVRSN
ncbi:MAG: type II secretion system protein [Candidatus Woesebacteria bacterium]|nr:MAG: type II secretion system protein [Candidatus Woesebacteria bacterium]